MSLPVLVKRDLAKEQRIRLQNLLESGKISPTEYTKRLAAVALVEEAWYYNPAKDYVKSAYFIPRQIGGTPYQVALAANGYSGIIPIEFDQGSGHGEIFAIVSNQTGDFEFQITDQGRRYSWSNRAVHSAAVTGIAQRPFILPLSYWVNVRAGTRQLSWEAWDLSGAPNTVRFALLGRRWIEREAPEEVQQKFREEFEAPDKYLLYFLQPQAPITALAPGATAVGEFIAPSDYPIDIKKLTVATSVAATPFEMEIKEYSTGRSFSSDGLRIHSDLMWGNGQYPAMPFESIFLPRNFRLTFSLTNLGGFASNFYPVMTGAKILAPVGVA